MEFLSREEFDAAKSRKVDSTSIKFSKPLKNLKLSDNYVTFYDPFLETYTETYFNPNTKKHNDQRPYYVNSWDKLVQPVIVDGISNSRFLALVVQEDGDRSLKIFRRINAFYF